jgi:hypothetical protein
VPLPPPPSTHTLFWCPARLGPSFELHVRGGGRIRVYTHTGIQLEMAMIIRREGGFLDGVSAAGVASPIRSHVVA